jgi:hypothetical protein
MRGVSVIDEEKYFLRIISSLVKVLKSFRHVKTINRASNLTFKEDASYRQLLSSDEEWDRALEKATFLKAYGISRNFSYICAF